MFHENQRFEEGHRPIGHSCKKKKREAKIQDTDRDKYTEETQIQRPIG